IFMFVNLIEVCFDLCPDGRSESRHIHFKRESEIGCWSLERFPQQLGTFLCQLDRYRCFTAIEHRRFAKTNNLLRKLTILCVERCNECNGSALVYNRTNNHTVGLYTAKLLSSFRQLFRCYTQFNHSMHNTTTFCLIGCFRSGSILNIPKERKLWFTIGMSRQAQFVRQVVEVVVISNFREHGDFSCPYRFIKQYLLRDCHVNTKAHYQDTKE